MTQNCPTPEIRDMGPLVPDPKYICSETQTRIRADQRQRWKQNIIGAIIFLNMQLLKIITRVPQAQSVKVSL